MDGWQVAHVRGIDITANLLGQAGQRATAEGLTIAFDEGDAEDLPYPEAALTEHYIPLPNGVPAPVLWGSEEVVRKRLGEENS